MQRYDKGLTSEVSPIEKMQKCEVLQTPVAFLLCAQQAGCGGLFALDVK